MRAEFRAHQISQVMQSAVLEAAMDSGLHVGALIIDKAVARRQSDQADMPSPGEFQFLAGIVLLEEFFTRYSLKGLWCDEDIKGKERQKEFTTAVKRAHRANWPGLQLKVRHSPSDSSDLIQLADIVAYGLSRLSRGETLRPQLRRHLEALWDDARNIIIGPKSW